MNAVQAKHAIEDMAVILSAAESAHKESKDSGPWAEWYARWIVENAMSTLHTIVQETQPDTTDYCSEGCW